MERPQLLGTDVERCRECRGHVVQAGAEFACTSCGVVTRREESVAEMRAASPAVPGRRLGSYMGRKEDETSTADFNGNSTIGYAKRLSDNIGLDQAEWNCAILTRRVADKLALPAFVRENAVALSGKMLADAREGEGPTRRRMSVPAISAYAILSACRAAGMDHIGSKTVLQTYVNLGHKVTRSRLLWLGTQEKVPLRPADPTALLRTVMAALESNGTVARKLAKSGTEPGAYYRRLLQASQTIVSAIRSMGEGRSPRTLAACAVYLASREMGPKVLTQKEAAESLGVAEYTVREFVAEVSHEFGFGPLNGGGP
jgi:transcription initiation factor TFIIIB Brf1 subunit/transcription initiation factor TFIIB